MANLLQTGATWLSQKFTDHASVEMTYKRGAASVTVNVVKGRTKSWLMDAGGSRQRFEWLEGDMLIDAAEIILDGAVTEPKVGDRIIEEHDDGDVTYEVSPDSSGERCWAWCDEFRIKMRIHTKEVDFEAA